MLYVVPTGISCKVFVTCNNEPVLFLYSYIKTKRKLLWKPPVLQSIMSIIWLHILFILVCCAIPLIWRSVPTLGLQSYHSVAICRGTAETYWSHGNTVRFKWRIPNASWYQACTKGIQLKSVLWLCWLCCVTNLSGWWMTTSSQKHELTFQG